MGQTGTIESAAEGGGKVSALDGLERQRQHAPVRAQGPANAQTLRQHAVRELLGRCSQGKERRWRCVSPGAL